MLHVNLCYTCIVLTTNGYNLNRSVIDGLVLIRSEGLQRLHDDPEPAAENEKRLWLFLDSVQDPMNFGSILRTAYWFGVHKIFVSSQNRFCDFLVYDQSILHWILNGFVQWLGFGLFSAGSLI